VPLAVCSRHLFKAFERVLRAADVLVHYVVKGEA
jgi:hypothetical protein